MGETGAKGRIQYAASNVGQVAGRRPTRNAWICNGGAVATEEQRRQLAELIVDLMPSRLRAALTDPAAASTLTMVDPELSFLVANVASHAPFSCALPGLGPEKLAWVDDFETNELFSPAERAALRVARDATETPSAITEAHFDELSQHFCSEEMVQIVATVNVFSFPHQWNSAVGAAVQTSGE